MWCHDATRYVEDVFFYCERNAIQHVWVHLLLCAAAAEETLYVTPPPLGWLSTCLQQQFLERMSPCHVCMYLSWCMSLANSCLPLASHECSTVPCVFSLQGAVARVTSIPPAQPQSHTNWLLLLLLYADWRWQAGKPSNTLWILTTHYTPTLSTCKGLIILSFQFHTAS